MDRKTFLALPVEEVVKTVQHEARPKVGAFVPDGSRRLVLALTEAKVGSEEFYRLCATLPAHYLLESLKVFFDHGLPTLLVPILSRSVLNRGKDYRLFTALEGLKLLFHSETWLSFYDQYDVRVKVYGEPEQLVGTECAEALAWIENICQQTSNHDSHNLFFAIGEAPWLGHDIAEMGIAFYQKHGRTPTAEEQIQEYYGEKLDPADFFIMTSKMSGMGALPRFIVNGDTEMYFLPAAGALGLNAQTYRLILYDLLFARKGLRVGKENYGGNLGHKYRANLRDFYQKAFHTVIGLGRQIGNIWVPEIP